jgi:phytoene synthase
LATSYEFCDDLARREARNFYFAFRLLPRNRRAEMSALYGFMRHTDDIADEPGNEEVKRLSLLQWRDHVDSALAGDPSAWPGLPALADVVARRGIPSEYLHAVIEGVSMDLYPRRFAHFDELSNYCYHVASAVGLCCIHIWGYDSDGGRAERLAEACGIALQLTNILRDVREDAINGRVYLPQDEIERFGVNVESFKADAPRPELRALLEFQAKRAYDYYDEAKDLIPLVSPVGRPVLIAIMGIYRALLDEIVRRDYNVLAGRVTIPAWRKAAIALRAFPHRFLSQTVERAPTATP